MRTYIIALFSCLVCIGVLSLPAYSQSPLIKGLMRTTGKNAETTLLRQQVEKELVSAAALERTLAAKAAPVLPAENSLAAQQAVFKMEPFFAQKLPSEKRFPANAFLISTKYKGKKEIWGITTSELIKGYGKDVVLRTIHDGKEIFLPAQAIQHGPRFLSNIVLLKVPQQLPKGIKPLEIALEYNTEKPLSLYTYNQGNVLSFPELTLQKDNGFFLRMDFTNLAETPHSVFGSTFGAPILSDGKAVGVFCNRRLNGGYASSLSMLPALLENVHKPHRTAGFPFRIKDHDFGTIYLNETIVSVTALDINGNSIAQEFFTEEMHQSSILRMINNPKTFLLRFEIRQNEFPHFTSDGKRSLLYYDVKGKKAWRINK